MNTFATQLLARRSQGLRQWNARLVIRTDDRRGGRANGRGA
jgi:hypothetical protein